VPAAIREHTLDVAEALPEMLFTEHVTPRQATVLGHLQAARAAIPHDADPALEQALSGAQGLALVA
jgi:hypothetical protein